MNLVGFHTGGLKDVNECNYANLIHNTLGKIPVVWTVELYIWTFIGSKMDFDCGKCLENAWILAKFIPSKLLKLFGIKCG